MRIALSGSGGTGKSTLAGEISKRYGIPLIPEYAREVALEMKIENIRKMSPDMSFEYQCQILERKISEEDKHETFIADRSTVDTMAYYLRWCSREIDDTKNKAYVDRCVERLKTYDQIIVLPPIIPLEADGFRSAKVYYQQEIHYLIVGILVAKGVKWSTLSEVDMEKRVTYVRSLYKD
jgi:nicotinamide riboside kinase